ncbi:MAG: phosphoglycerate kinase [Bacteroidetes bacterium]|jgi:phosphoglycerate kinase|nr:phosphoglycerate kinase [Bacteroidota bacterium]
MRTIKDYNFKDKRAIIRVDFNVPLDKKTFEVTDDTRLKAAIPTIKKVLEDGGSVVLMSHLGRPKGGPEDKYSLKHIVKHLSELVGQNVKFADDCIGDDVRFLALNLLPGEILLLENLRFHPEEEAGDKDFAIQLSELGNVYINDAFGTAHRAHASTTIVAELYTPENKMAGYLLAAEVDAANKVLNDHEKPFTAIIGGAKVSDKIMILEKLVEKADHIIVGGGMAYTFIKAMGGDIGNSLCEEDKLDLAKQLIENAKSQGATILLPIDSVIADKFDNEAARDTCISNIIPSGWMALDIGQKAIKDFSDVILASKTILWNGPMGVFEMENFSNGTIQIAKAIAQATKNGAYSLVGGGDSVAAVNKFNLSDQVSYVSTGGGAMLEFFEGKVLPGVAAIDF